MQFSPVHKIRDVVRHLYSSLQSTSLDGIVICKDAEMLKQETLLGTLADARGTVEVSLARFDTMPLWKMKREALRRALCHANAGEWGAWSRALSEASSLEAEERKYMDPLM